MAEKENEKGENDDEDEEKEVAERRDEAYATITSSAVPDMRVAGGCDEQQGGQLLQREKRATDGTAVM